MGIGFAQASEDQLLVEAARELLSELLGTEWALVAEDPDQRTSHGELCILDSTLADSATRRGPEPAKPRKDWFFVRRNDLPALQGLLGTADRQVLLKPVTRSALRYLLDRVDGNGNDPKQDCPGLADALRLERNEMLQFLIQANLKLQETDRERNNFLARSVHDFHAPLTAISGYCGLLLEEEFGPLTPEQRRVLERMLHSATRLSRISTGMFQLSVPHYLDQRMSVENVDIRDCFDQALREVALVIEDKRISVVAEIEPAPDGLLADKSQIEQTLVNLLDNACKFTPREGTIQVKGYPFFWERRTGQAAGLDRARERRVKQARVFNSFRVDIRDSGPGIPSVNVDTVFEEYTSYGGGQDRSGGGIGLAICRMVLQRHQGRIWAESSPTGAVFSFALPLQQAAAHQSETDNDTGAVRPAEN